ncbi:MAG: HD domain-containing phosphohydrolase [bacterium]
MYPTLLVESGLFQGSRYLIYASFRIGRHPDNDLQLTDQNISRFHAIIEPKQGGLVLRDLGSRNGTFVNDQRVEEAWLQPGDQIRIGKIRMRLTEEPPAQRPRAHPTATMVLQDQLTARIKARTLSGVKTPWDTEPKDPAIALQLSRLQALYQTNIMLSHEKDLNGVFQRLLEQILQVLDADRAVVMMLDPLTKELQLRLSLARPQLGQLGDLLVSQTIVKQVLQDGAGLLIEDTLSQQPCKEAQIPGFQSIKSALCVPLLDRGQTMGVLYVDVLRKKRSFSQDDLQLLTAMAAPTSVQIRNIQFMEQIQQAYLDTLSVLANAIEARDHYTVGHTWRVTRMALAMVDHMGCDAQKRKYTEMGGILHDVGKIAVEDSILRKTGPLSPEEYQKMQLHPEHGARMLKDVEFLKPVVPYVLFHQERWDGKGYPFGLARDDVPWEGRLLAVCDAFDAMTSHRPYRQSMEPREAVVELKKYRGRQFDPQMVDLFLEVWAKGEVARILQDYAKGEGSVPCPFCSTHIPLGEDPKEGTFLECPVCTRTAVVLREGHGWRADLA